MNDDIKENAENFEQITGEEKAMYEVLLEFQLYFAEHHLSRWTKFKNCIPFLKKIDSDYPQNFFDEENFKQAVSGISLPIEVIVSTFMEITLSYNPLNYVPGTELAITKEDKLIRTTNNLLQGYFTKFTETRPKVLTETSYYLSYQILVDYFTELLSSLSVLGLVVETERYLSREENFKVYSVNKSFFRKELAPYIEVNSEDLPPNLLVHGSNYREN